MHKKGCNLLNVHACFAVQMSPWSVKGCPTPFVLVFSARSCHLLAACCLARTVPWLQSELQYNLALCCYKLKQYSLALKHLAEIVEKGVREHPELGIGRCGYEGIQQSLHSMQQQRASRM